MKTLRKFSALAATTMSVFLLVALGGAAPAYAGGVPGAIIEFFEGVDGNRKRKNDEFSVLLRYATRDDRLKMSCFKDYDNNKTKTSWTHDVLHLDDISKKQRGKECWKGMVRVYVVGKDDKWRRVGDLYPCPDRKHMSFAWVTHVSADKKSARLMSGCVSHYNHEELPEPDSDKVHRISNVRGDKTAGKVIDNSLDAWGYGARKDDYFSALLYTTARESGKDIVQLDCLYNYEADYHRGWRQTVSFWHDVNKDHRGRGCDGRGKVSIHIKNKNGGTKWIQDFGKCSDSKKMRFIWVTKVDAEKRKARLRAGCLHNYDRNNLPLPDSDVFKTYGNM